eukprot:6991653-Karenia_brevis.AAC.1
MEQILGIHLATVLYHEMRGKPSIPHEDALKLCVLLRKADFSIQRAFKLQKSAIVRASDSAAVQPLAPG